MAFATLEEDKPGKCVPTKIVWGRVLTFSSLHVCALIGFYLACTSALWKTIFFAAILYTISMIGITAGAHRLWSHRTYKAKLPLRILLAFFMTISFQFDIFWWSRDHRVHHKFTETNADPYNAKRGLFFSHIGWLLVRKHPDASEEGKSVDVSDLLADPVVVFQRKYYPLLATLCCFVLPTAVPKILWEESIFNSFFVAGFLRLVFCHHTTFTVNSFAHMYGIRPYTEHVEARENMHVNFWVFGEGFHNFHHAFPWDYSTSEFGAYFNLSTAFINLMAWCGLAYDLKTAPREAIRRRKQEVREGRHQQAKSQMSEMD